MTKEVKRKIIEIIKDRLNDIIPNTPIIQAYEDTINNMTDTELEHWIIALENGVLDFPDVNQPSATINIVVPNLDKNNRLNINRNLALAKKMGYDFFEQCWLTNPITGKTTLTNRRYLSLLLPIRRQAQTLDHKISVAENDKKIDDLTGQVTGESKGAGLSYPEVQMLDAQGLTQTSYELLKARGGDEASWRLMKNRLLITGEVTLTEIDQLDSRAKVNDTFQHFLAGMHIKSNL